jgi:hypothetical protein
MIILFVEGMSVRLRLFTFKKKSFIVKSTWLTQQESLNRAEKNKNEHSNKIADLLANMNLSVLTVWVWLLLLLQGL